MLSEYLDRGSGTPQQAVGPRASRDRDSTGGRPPETQNGPVLDTARQVKAYGYIIKRGCFQEQPPLLVHWVQ